MGTFINKQEVTMKCRILGVHVNASLTEFKQARDRLAKLYHPDKHMQEPQEVRDQIQERFKTIQSSYRYIKDNYEAIQQEFKHFDDFILTSKEAAMNRAHWVYKTVETYT
jgi:DnaJ-class molecular chaperone